MLQNLLLNLLKLSSRSDYELLKELANKLSLVKVVVDQESPSVSKKMSKINEIAISIYLKLLSVSVKDVGFHKISRCREEIGVITNSVEVWNGCLTNLQCLIKYIYLCILGSSWWSY